MLDLDSLFPILPIIIGLFAGTGVAVSSYFTNLNKSNNLGSENGRPKDFRTRINIVTARDGLHSAPNASPISKKGLFK